MDFRAFLSNFEHQEGKEEWEYWKLDIVQRELLIFSAKVDAVGIGRDFQGDDVFVLPAVVKFSTTLSASVSGEAKGSWTWSWAFEAEPGWSRDLVAGSVDIDFELRIALHLLDVEVDIRFVSCNCSDLWLSGLVGSAFSRVQTIVYRSLIVHTVFEGNAVREAVTDSFTFVDCLVFVGIDVFVGHVSSGFSLVFYLWLSEWADVPLIRFEACSVSLDHPACVEFIKIDGDGFLWTNTDGIACQVLLPLARC